MGFVYELNVIIPMLLTNYTAVNGCMKWVLPSGVAKLNWTIFRPTPHGLKGRTPLIQLSIDMIEKHAKSNDCNYFTIMTIIIMTIF